MIPEHCAIVPHTNEHPQAIELGLGRKEDSRKRAHAQVRDSVKDPHWQHPAAADKLSVASS